MRRLVILLAAAAMLLAACGSSGGDTATATATSPPTSVRTASNAALGAILTDTDGMTLYTLTNDGADVPCTGQCAVEWPPLAGTSYYRYIGDRAPGDVNGEGLASYGGVWHVARPAGADAGTTVPAGSGSQGGYGY